MNRILMLLMAGTALSVLGAPEISNVGIAVDSDNGNVTVTYDLSEDAIVTAEFEVDGQRITGAAGWRISGDVHKRVTAGGGENF